MALLRGLHCLLLRQLAAQKLSGLLVAKGDQWTNLRPVAADELLGLVYQTHLEHLARALVNTFVQLGAVRVEPQSQNPKAVQRIASFLPEFADLLPGGTAHLDRPDQFRRIIGMDVFGSCGVKPAQDPVKVIRSPARCSFP